MATPPSVDGKAEELAAIAQEIRERVRARYPGGSAGAGIALPDLTPVLHARDAALGKVAAIGTVNPRPPGLVSGLVQSAKRLIARALDWHVRDQVEFNRAAVAAIDALIEALNENNRALAAIGPQLSELRSELKSETAGLRPALAELTQQHAELRTQAGELLEETAKLKDIRTHWHEWRKGWETKLAAIETQFLRSVADLQIGFQHRVTLIESGFRETVRSQHADFLAVHERAAEDLQRLAWKEMAEAQQRMWADLERIRVDFERLIHSELRMIRQRAALAGAAAFPARLQEPGAAAQPEDFDYAQFAERFRGSEEYVREGQRFYAPFFRERRSVLDIGCGRGEFLELMKESGIPARGIDLSAESVALCRSKGLEADVADLFPYLESLDDGALDGIFCAQVIEHLPPQRLPGMLRLACSKLERGGVLAIETPNPECLAIFSTHFFIDPTHQRPVPPQLLVFYLEEFGMVHIRVERRSPAGESLPAVNSLPPDFRDAFFGGLDYCAIAVKL